MATQPLTPMALAVLGLLAERPMHPYEMHQTLVERREDRVMKLRASTLYHAVARLEETKLVLAQGIDRAGNRPERTTYEITDDGRRRLRQRLIEMLGTPAEEYPAFLLAIAEAHNLPRETVLTELHRRRGLLAGRLHELTEGIADADHRQVARRYRLDADYDRVLRTAELTWIDDLIADLATDTIPWTDGDRTETTS